MSRDPWRNFKRAYHGLQSASNYLDSAAEKLEDGLELEPGLRDQKHGIEQDVREAERRLDEVKRELGLETDNTDREGDTS